MKRGRSPGGTSGPDSGTEVNREQDKGPSNSRRGRKSGRLDISPSAEDEDDSTDEEPGDVTMGDSGWNLSMRLELAHQNSQIQQSRVQHLVDGSEEDPMMTSKCKKKIEVVVLISFH